MITQAQLQTIKDNYLEARKSLHPAHNWDLGMARNALLELASLVGGSKVDLIGHASGDILVNFKDLGDRGNELLPLFEGILHRHVTNKYGEYKTTFYGHFSPWFYVIGWQALHNQILSWGE